MMFREDFTSRKEIIELRFIKSNPKEHNLSSYLVWHKLLTMLE